MSNNPIAETATNIVNGIALAACVIMYIVGGAVYGAFAAGTYERQYQVMMQEALQRGYIMRCPGVSDLRWDCNERITMPRSTNLERAERYKRDEPNVQNSP
jgi:hypothetical protein